MELFQYVDKAVGILSALLAIGTGLGQIRGLTTVQKRIEAVDDLLADRTESNSVKENPLLEARRKLQARAASIILVPRAPLYLHVLIFLGCLVLVFFPDGEARDSIIWNLVIMIFMIIGASGVIRIAGARAAIYTKILQDSGTPIPATPLGFFEGRNDQLLLRIVFSFVAIFVATFSIVVLLLAVLSEWLRVTWVVIVVIPFAYMCWRAWRQYVKSLLLEHQRSLPQLLNEEIEQLKILGNKLRRRLGGFRKK